MSLALIQQRDYRTYAGTLLRLGGHLKERELLAMLKFGHPDRSSQHFVEGFLGSYFSISFESFAGLISRKSRKLDDRAIIAVYVMIHCDHTCWRDNTA